VHVSLTCLGNDSTFGAATYPPKRETVALKILLADDSLTAQNMGKKILTEAGYEVIAVSNGAQAMKKIVSDRPDLVVLDVYMPGYTGLELCERMRNSRETARTPVLLSVGKMEPFKHEEGTRVRADGVIVKPFEATELVATVKRLAENLSPEPHTRRTPEPDNVPEMAAEYSSVQAESEFEIQHQAIQIPSEIASTPVIGMELIPDEAPEAAPPAATESAAAEPIEFEVERYPEPAEVDTSRRMASAAGLSGVFEMAPSAPPVVEAPAESAPVEEFETFLTPADDPTPPSQVEPPAVDAGSSMVAHEFPGDEPQGFGGEVQFESQAPVPAQVTWPTTETSTSEYAVERLEHREPEAELQSATPPPDLSSWGEPSPQASQNSVDWTIPAPETTLPVEVPDRSADPTLSDSASDLAAAGAVWVAEEAEVEPHESAVSLHEQMQRRVAVSEALEPEPTASSLVSEEASVQSWEAPEPFPAEPEPQGAELSAFDAAEILPESQPSSPTAWTEEQPEIQSADPEFASSDTDFPANPAASEPAPTTEPALEVDHHAGDPAMAAVPEPEPPTILPTIIEAPIDPVRIARIVDQVIERFKPELIAAVTRELEKKEQ
jgi:DNA-binding response OmpR family regulator